MIGKYQPKAIDIDKKAVTVRTLGAICMMGRSWDSGTTVSCLREAVISQEVQAASIDHTDDSFKLLAKNLEELKWVVLWKKALFEIDDYVDVHFNVSANEFSTLTMNKYYPLSVTVTENMMLLMRSWPSRMKNSFPKNVVIRYCRWYIAVRKIVSTGW